MSGSAICFLIPSHAWLICVLARRYASPRLPDSSVSMTPARRAESDIPLNCSAVSLSSGTISLPPRPNASIARRDASAESGIARMWVWISLNSPSMSWRWDATKSIVMPRSLKLFCAASFPSTASTAFRSSSLNAPPIVSAPIFTFCPTAASSLKNSVLTPAFCRRQRGAARRVVGFGEQFDQRRAASAATSFSRWSGLSKCSWTTPGKIWATPAASWIACENPLASRLSWPVIAPASNAIGFPQCSRTTAGIFAPYAFSETW